MQTEYAKKDSLPMARIKVLSTKKLLPSLIEQANQNDIEILEQDFISVKPAWNLQTSHQILELAKVENSCIAVTSAAAVEVLNTNLPADSLTALKDCKIFCLSGKTKRAVLEGPFAKNISGEAETAAALAREIIAQGIREIVFPCSNIRRDELPAALQEAGMKVYEIVVYETIEIPSPASTKGLDALLFFSPSGVQSFFSVNQLQKETVCFAIGPTTAQSISGYTNNQVIVSPSPDQRVLVEEVLEHFKKRS